MVTPEILKNLALPFFDHNLGDSTPPVAQNFSAFGVFLPDYSCDPFDVATFCWMWCFTMMNLSDFTFFYHFIPSIIFLIVEITLS